jgi:hypothetical protein
MEAASADSELPRSDSNEESLDAAEICMYVCVGNECVCACFCVMTHVCVCVCVCVCTVYTQLGFTCMTHVCVYVCVCARAFVYVHYIHTVRITKCRDKRICCKSSIRYVAWNRGMSTRKMSLCSK